MGITTQLRTATPGVGLTGGSRSNTGHVGKGLEKLAGWFKRDKTSDAPRVKGGRDFTDRHRMQLSKSPGTIDLARLYKGETARIKQERKIDPLPKNGLDDALKAITGSTIYKRDEIAGDMVEIGRTLDGFNSGQKTVHDDDGVPRTLSELKGALDNYAVWLRDELGGDNDALDGHIEKAVALLADISARISEKLGTDTAKQTAPVTQAQQVQQSQPTPPPETLQDKVGRLSGERDKIRTQVDDISNLHHAMLEKPGARAGKWAEKQTELTGARLKAHAEIDKALVEVNQLIAANTSDPGKAGEVATLKALRAELTRLAVGAEFPDLVRSAPQTFSKQEVKAALRGIANVPPHASLDHDQIRTQIASDTAYVTELIDGFNAGHNPVVLQDGTSVSLTQFRDELAAYMRNLERWGSEGVTPEASAAVDAALTRLSELHKQVSIRVGLDETVAALGPFQSVPENTLTDVQKAQQRTSLDQITPTDLQTAGLNQQDIDPKGRVGSKPPSVGMLLRAIRTAMPSIDIDGQNSTLTQKRNASEALGTLCQMTVDGEAPDMLLGHGTALDQTLLALKQERAGGTPPLTKQELIDHAKRRKAVALRQELSIANRRLDSLLKIKGHQVFGQGAANIRKDTAFIEALHNLGGRKAGREVAFLIARISDLETKTFALEQEALGLHPGLDLATFKPRDPNIVPDPNAPKPGILEHAGITDEDLGRMGLTGQDRAELGRLVVELNGKGMGGVKDVERTSSSINKAINQVLRSELAQTSIDRFNKDTADGLGRALLNEFLVDAQMVETGHLPTSHAISVKDPDVAKTFQRQTRQVEERINARDPGQLHKLSDGASDYRDTQLKMVKLLGEFDKIEKTSDTHRDRLTRLNRDVAKGGLGLKVDNRNPRGLDSAKAIIEALDADEALKTDPNNQELIAKREGALDRLKGFDPVLMHTPWTNIRGGRPTIATLAERREAAESIIYLRETANQEKQAIDQQLVVHGTIMDDILSERASTNPFEIEATRQLVRTAILGAWPPGTREFTFSNGRTVEGYDPATKRDEIIAQLKNWGLDTVRFGPEIDKEIYGTLTLTDMQRWSKEAQFSNDLRSREVTFQGAFLGLDSLSGKRDMDEATKRALLSSLETLVDGGKLSLKAGHRVTLDTGKIPLDPSGANTLKAKLAGASLGHIEVERSSDGYRLHLRSGGEGKVGVDYALGYKLGDFAKAELAGASAEGSLSYTGGVTLTFKGDDKGRQSLLNLMAKMIDNKPVGVSDWSDAIDVAESSETAGKGSVTGRTGIRIEGMYKPEGGGKNDKTGVGLYAELSGMAGISGKSTDIGSLREHTHKGEVEVTTGVTFSTQLYARIGNPLNIATSQASQASGLTGAANENYDLSPFQNTDLISGSVGVSGTYTQKWKQVTDDQGFYTKGEIVRQTDVTTDPVISLLVVSNDVIAKGMEEHPEFAENLRTMLAMVGRDDIVAVTYSLKPESQLHANALLDQAKSLRRDGEKGRAKELESRAKAIAEDPANHVPSKISVISTKIDKNEVSNINARWVRWDVYSDGKLEYPALSINLA